MLEELGVHFIVTVGVELIISACHQIHSIPYATAADFRVMGECMEQNMSLPYKEHMSTMFPVLCV